MLHKSKYDPKKHRRRSIRLKGYDYSQVGSYFITICCANHECRFGFVANDEMMFNDYGKIAHQEWIRLKERFPRFQLDVFQIMPNHMHAILVLDDLVGATLAVNPDDGVETNDRSCDDRAQASRPPMVGDIIGAYKSLVVNECLSIYKSRNEIMGKLWQRNYYEHIIRNQQSYQKISNYIINNPVHWQTDKFHK